MTLTHEAVVAASNAWIWVPDDATTVETTEYLMIRYPDYFEVPLQVVSFSPAGDVADGVDTVLERAREFRVPHVWWMVRLNSPAETGRLLVDRGAVVTETFVVLAGDLTEAVAPLPSAAVDVTLRWGTDVATQRDAQAISAEVFGGTVPPEERLAAEAELDAKRSAAGEGGMLVAYVDGKPVGFGGVHLVDGVARFYGSAVAEPMRGQGIYREITNARLAYAAANGAKLALVKGRIETSGPILRQAGFTAHGQEIVYRVPLQ